MSEYVNEGRNISGNILEKIQEMIFPEEVEVEGTGYRRNIIDRRIELYLDRHFDEYIEEYGLVRELDLEVYEEKYRGILEGVEEIKEFQMDALTEIQDLKRRLDRIEERR